MSKKIEKTIDGWCHALLDLGRRNRMICYRPSKRRSLEITEPAYDILYERLVGSEGSLSFCRPIDRRSAPRTHAVLLLFSMLGHPLKVTVGDLDYAPDYEEAQKALSHMRSQYRLAHEEQGCHILYLSFGFLSWRDGRGGAKGSPFVRSPLVLVPVELSQKTPASPYTLKRRDDDIVLNPALQLAFEEKGISLPPFDESEKNISAYFDLLDTLADDNGWTVERSVSLGLLSFQKISMYRDLDANRARLAENPFVRAMAGERGLFSALSSPEPDEEPYREKFTVLPADSTQESAILAAKRGESFVMEGPPGTGKSQTITNIIAEFLQSGKKVLFVSGKNAALQVVYRRLQETGLAPFCLSLHSHRANKREILNDITASLSLKAKRVSENEERELVSLEEKRAELNAYRDALHTPIAPLGYTPRECMALLCERKTPIVTLPSLPADRETFFSWLSLAAKYDEARAVYLADAPRVPTALFGLRQDACTEELTDALVSLGNALVTVSAASRRAGVSLDCLTVDALSPFATLCEGLAALPDSVLAKATRESVRQSLATLSAMREASRDRAIFEKTLDRRFESFDLALWQIELSTLLSYALGDSLVNALYPEKNADGLFASLDGLLELCDILYRENETIFAAVKELSSRLDCPISYDYATLSAYRQYLPYLSETVSFDPAWHFDEGFDEAAVRFAKKNADALRTLEGEITRIWRPDVFELDYKRLRERFSSNIQGFFAFVSSNSRREIRKLLTSYKIDGSPSDDEITALFDSLADRALILRRYQNKEEAVRSLLGDAYRGVYTDFDAILSSYAFYRSIPRELFPLPDAVVGYFGLSSCERPYAKKAFASLCKAQDTLSRAVSSRKGLACILDNCFNAEISLKLARNRLDALKQKYREILPFVKGTASYGTLNEALAAYRRYRAFCETSDKASFDGESFFASLHAILPLVTDENALIDCLLTLAERKGAKALARELLRATETVGEALSGLNGIFFEKSLGALSLPRAKKRVAELLECAPQLTAFAELGKCYAVLCERRLGEVARAYEALNTDAPLEAVLKNSVLTAEIALAKREREALGSFSRARLTRTASSFASLDTRHSVSARKRIAARLVASMPNAEREWRGEDELTVLRHEGEKRRGHMPLRKLFAKIPNLLLTLKPCFMMSPLSVSYFLEKESYAFDLVIFDEASQLFPEDAVGAVMRGKQVIIVGDTKQLPPTDFFSTRSENADESDGDEEEDYDAIDSASILESAATVLPRRRLLWHYRSRYESLIAFSNHKIYHRELVTFPSPIPDTEGVGVEYCYLPDGVYEAGKGYNLREAERAVELLREHIETKPDKSLGIIAFGKKQQSAIEEAVTAFRLDNPQYEDFFAEGREEPFFIKNLENVQGDERDTVIFSIGYGKNARGRFSMNFGPLTKLGGERRLNVAITRAKENVKLIGSILPNDFRLAESESEGAHLLRAYIDYALHKDKALADKESQTELVTDGFSEAVADFLQAEGYTVKQGFGSSSCRVELAVFHRSHGGALAALLTDGESYRLAGSARDREHLVGVQLKRMGWRVYRLYAAAWLFDEEREKRLLLEFLKNAAEQEEENECLPISASEPTESVSDTVSEGEVGDDGREGAPYGFAYYECEDPMRAALCDYGDRLATARDRMRYLVEREAPIGREWLYRRLAATFRSGKLTESVKKLLDAAWQLLEKEGFFEDGEEFLYPRGFTVPIPRIPRDEASLRPFDCIAKEELAEAICVILRSAFGVLPDGLYHELLRVYGYERMTPKARARCEAALFTLLVSERARLVDGKIVLV